nr:hypothetical protein [Bacillota bacterium]
MSDLSKAAAVLAWDEQTYMPTGGARARADQQATLSRLIHSLFTSPEVGELLDQLAEDVRDLPPDSDEAAVVRLARRQYDQAVKLPADLVEALSRASSEGFNAWIEARRSNDFAVFRPKLERLVELQRQKADALGWRDRRYDALLDLFEPGMKTADVERTFSILRDQLVPLLGAIRERLDAVDDSVLRRGYPADQQWEFTVELLEAIGFDFKRGRQDRSEHPFTIAFSVDDVRITTRINEEYLAQSIFSTIHEAGHAFHSLLCRKDPLLAYRSEIPLEFCEVASMSMELTTHDFLGEYYQNPEDAARAVRVHLEQLATLLPWIATIDQFQHWIYTNPSHTREQRRDKWIELN